MWADFNTTPLASLAWAWASKLARHAARRGPGLHIAQPSTYALTKCNSRKVRRPPNVKIVLKPQIAKNVLFIR
jgi:hypothetical protein